jgi:hypothetical protein
MYDMDIAGRRAIWSSEAPRGHSALLAVRWGYVVKCRTPGALLLSGVRAQCVWQICVQGTLSAFVVFSRSQSSQVSGGACWENSLPLLCHSAGRRPENAGYSRPAGLLEWASSRNCPATEAPEELAVRPGTAMVGRAGGGTAILQDTRLQDVFLALCR